MMSTYPVFAPDNNAVHEYSQWLYQSNSIIGRLFLGGLVMIGNMIFELDENESSWWKDAIKKERKKIIKQPREYVQEVLARSPIQLEHLRVDATSEIYRVRDICWNNYLLDEIKFHGKVISKLVNERKLPRDILKCVKEEKAHYGEADDLTGLADIVGDFSGRIMPYLYALSLSTTNSRRSRAGQTFEEIIDSIMYVYGYPYVSQGQLGSKFYKDNGLGKLIDGLIPSAEAYTKDRSHCLILTMKTTLRERWQEVVEEISRTNIPRAYLLTLDQDLTTSALDTMNHHNITVVACDHIKEKFLTQNNVISFTELFNKRIPHALSFWQ